MPGRTRTRAPIRPSQGRNRPLASRYEPWRLGAERLQALACADNVPAAMAAILDRSARAMQARLKQVPEAQGKQWRSVNNVGEALDDVISGRSTAAMIAPRPCDSSQF